MYEYIRFNDLLKAEYNHSVSVRSEFIHIVYRKNITISVCHRQYMCSISIKALRRSENTVFPNASFYGYHKH